MSSKVAKLSLKADSLLVGPKPTGRPVIVGELDRRTLHRPQGPDSGVNALIGKWPGSESDEEIIALLEELS